MCSKDRMREEETKRRGEREGTEKGRKKWKKEGIKIFICSCIVEYQ